VSEPHKCRTHWQILASKKYPRMFYVNGDGDAIGFECWLVLSKCKHEGTSRWCYALRPTEAEAQSLLEKWNRERCSHYCEGPAMHSL